MCTPLVARARGRRDSVLPRSVAHAIGRALWAGGAPLAIGWVRVVRPVRWRVRREGGRQQLGVVELAEAPLLGRHDPKRARGVGRRGAAGPGRQT